MTPEVSNCHPTPAICVETLAPLSHVGNGSGGPYGCLQLRWDACDAIISSPCQGLVATLIPAKAATTTTPAEPARSLLWVEKWSGNLPSIVTTAGNETQAKIVAPSDAAHRYLLVSHFGGTGNCAWAVESQIVVNGVTTGWAPSGLTRTVTVLPGQTAEVHWRAVGDTTCLRFEVTGYGLETLDRAVECGLPAAGTCTPTATTGGGSGGVISGTLGCGLSTTGGVTSVAGAAIAGTSAASSLRTLGACSVGVIVDDVTIGRTGTGALTVLSVPSTQVTGFCATSRACITTVTPLTYSAATGVIGFTSSTPGFVLTSNGANAGWAPSQAAQDLQAGCGITLTPIVGGKQVSVDLTAIAGTGLTAVGCKLNVDTSGSLCTNLAAIQANGVAAATTRLVGTDCRSYTLPVGLPVGVAGSLLVHNGTTWVPLAPGTAVGQKLEWTAAGPAWV